MVHRRNELRFKPIVKILNLRSVQLLYDLNSERNNFTSMSKVIVNRIFPRKVEYFRSFTMMPGSVQVLIIQTKLMTCTILFGIMVICRSKALLQIQFKSILGSKFNQSMKVSTFSNHHWLISVFSKYFKRIYGYYTQYVNDLAGCSLILGHLRLVIMRFNS